MNGSNSNTNGAEVANVGFWQKSILPAVIAATEGIVRNLKGLQTGTLLPASVDFASFGGSDKISDDVLEEISRRLIVTVEKEAPGNIIYSSTEPEDHTKLWVQTNAITGIPINGKVKQYDSVKAEWVYVDQLDATYTPPAKRHGRMISNAGASLVNFEFADIKTTDYSVNLTPTFRAVDDGSWNTPPVSFPNGFGYALGNKTSTSISVSFYGIPTGGLVWEVDIEDRETDA